MASCQAITKAGEPCSSGALAGSDRCLAHSSPEVRARYRFGGPQVGSGRPRTPRVGELVAVAAVNGSLPPRALRLLREWARLHEDELADNWERAQALEPLVPIEPLA